MAVEVDGWRDDGGERDSARYGEIRVMSELFYCYSFIIVFCAAVVIVLKLFRCHISVIDDNGMRIMNTLTAIITTQERTYTSDPLSLIFFSFMFFLSFDFRT